MAVRFLGDCSMVVDDDSGRHDHDERFEVYVFSTNSANVHGRRRGDDLTYPLRIPPGRLLRSAAGQRNRLVEVFQVEDFILELE